MQRASSRTHPKALVDQAAELALQLLLVLDVLFLVVAVRLKSEAQGQHVVVRRIDQARRHTYGPKPTGTSWYHSSVEPALG